MNITALLLQNGLLNTHKLMHWLCKGTYRVSRQEMKQRHILPAVLMLIETDLSKEHQNLMH